MVASFLRAYIRKEDALLAELKRDGDKAIFTYDYFSKEKGCWFEDGYGRHPI